MDIENVKRINIARKRPLALLKDTLNPIVLLNQSNHDDLNPLRVNTGSLLYKIPFPIGEYITNFGTPLESKFHTEFNTLLTPQSCYVSFKEEKTGESYLDACDYLNFVTINKIFDATEVEGIIFELKNKLNLEVFKVKYVMVDSNEDVTIEEGYSYTNRPMFLKRSPHIGTVNGPWWCEFDILDAIDNAIN